MKFLNRFNESDLIFFDIETAPQTNNLQKGTALWDAWEYKTRHENEHLRKTGEVMTVEDYFYEKAALYGVFGQVVAIVAGRISADGKILNTKKYYQDTVRESKVSEFDVLYNFNKDINAIIDDRPMSVLCGWASVGFDIPFLTKRMIVHGIEPNLLLDTAGSKPWEVPAIDLKDLWKSTGFYPDSLIATAVALGLPSPKSKMDGQKVAAAFFAGFTQDIADYCEQDVLTVANIYRKFKNQPLVSLKS